MQITYKTQEIWLKSRLKGIGGSDASAVVGYNPYKTNVDLWEEKCGLKKPIDISEKPYVKFGHNAEPLMVDFFNLDYPQYEVNYNNNFRVNYNDNYNFIFCTRDCDLVDKETGEKGALEIKTTEVLSSMHREKWKDHIPDNYYCQVLQYFITDNELKFVWVKARIKSDFGNGDIRATIRHYYFTREQCKEDINWLLEKEVDFWKNNIEKQIRPAVILPEI